MNEIKLSYVITTFNKLPYLKEVMRVLLENVQHDEEIVIADGGSTDGTQEYLSSLFQKGKIHQYVSEKDKGEAHGYNKTFLMAKGEFIKVITDDDVFHYPAIRECRKFMEDNPSIDALVGNNGTADISICEPPFLNPEMKDEFHKWATGINENFYCNGLPLMIRKSSLPAMGLFNLQYLCVDLEYTIRTSKIANYAFADQFIVIRIVNRASNGELFAQKAKQEQLHLCQIYNYPIPGTWRNEEIVISKISELRRLKNYIKRLLEAKKNNEQQIGFEKNDTVSLPKLSITEVYRFYSLELDKLNQNRQPQFFRKERS